jgi:citrate/tricarballylate utilization protein
MSAEVSAAEPLTRQATGSGSGSITDTISEAKRQIEICNACRYCEGYCAVFPAVTRQRSFSDGDITQLANLCHNCRGCYYACQFIEPHEFDLNVPAALARVRQDSWESYAAPAAVSRVFHRAGVPIALLAIVCFAALFFLAKALGSAGGEGFYAVMSHTVMVSIFLPAFLLPLLSIAVSLRRYWRAVGGQAVKPAHVWSAIRSAADMRNLAGGHGEGCNFEDEDRFTNTRRKVHQVVLWGFVLCFASTSVATIMHYLLQMPAPYPLFSLPKLFGLTGGIMLCVGTLAMMLMKSKGDRALGDTRVWGGEMGFILLLFLVSATGLFLYWFGQGGALPWLLAIHLGAVLAFFLLMPFSKMAHGFYRMAALVRDAQQKDG